MDAGDPHTRDPIWQRHSGLALVGCFADGRLRPIGRVIAGLGVASFAVTMLTLRQARRLSVQGQAQPS